MKKVLLFCLMLMSPALLAKEFASGPMEVHPLLDGTKVPNVTVQTPDGSPVSLQGMFMQRPSVVLFYRGGWCPYCNRQMAGLKTIEDSLDGMGYQVIAISPESPEKLQAQKLKIEMKAKLLSDANLKALEAFGVGFYVDEDTEKRYQQYNIELTKAPSGQSVLPAPAIFIVDSSGVIRFSYVNPDFTVRPAASMIEAVARSLVELPEEERIR